jgi:hypothetical protein
LTGDSIWRSDKIKGAVMQISVDPEANLLAVVLAKDAKNRARDGFKRIHCCTCWIWPPATSSGSMRSAKSK